MPWFILTFVIVGVGRFEHFLSFCANPQCQFYFIMGWGVVMVLIALAVGGYVGYSIGDSLQEGDTVAKPIEEIIGVKKMKKSSKGRSRSRRKSKSKVKKDRKKSKSRSSKRKSRSRLSKRKKGAIIILIVLITFL